MNEGKLTTEHREKLATYLNGKAPLIGKCPLCADRRWGLLDHFVHLPIFREDGAIMFGGPSYPNVGLICQNCGNTQLVNAVSAGILEGEPATPAVTTGPPK